MNNEFVVGEYIFATIDEANIAKAEKEKVDKLEEKLVKADISMLYKVYNKSIENQTFRTPVGLEFMSKLKRTLDASKETEGKVLPIPVNMPYIDKTDDSTNSKIKNLKLELEKKKNTAKWSIIINFALVAVVIIMFVISATADSPNILNYKNKIVDQYSSWEQELTQREAEVKKKEAMFNE